MHYEEKGFVLLPQQQPFELFENLSCFCVYITRSGDIHAADEVVPSFKASELGFDAS